MKLLLYEQLNWNVAVFSGKDNTDKTKATSHLYVMSPNPIRCLVIYIQSLYDNTMLFRNVISSLLWSKINKNDHGFPQPNVNKVNTFVWQESSSSACSQDYEKKNTDGNLTRSQRLPKRQWV